MESTAEQGHGDNVESLVNALSSIAQSIERIKDLYPTEASAIVYHHIFVCVWGDPSTYCSVPALDDFMSDAPARTQMTKNGESAANTAEVINQPHPSTPSSHVRVTAEKDKDGKDESSTAPASLEHSQKPGSNVPTATSSTANPRKRKATSAKQGNSGDMVLHGIAIRPKRVKTRRGGET